MIEKFRWLAAVIAAHPGGCLCGRTRLQKTVWILQRIGFPTDYVYTNYFYGPYSEGIQADIRLLERVGLALETQKVGLDGTPYYVFESSPDSALKEIEPFQPRIDLLSEQSPVVLELAATYDAYRVMGLTHEKSLELLRQTKDKKCLPESEMAMWALLQELRLWSETEIGHTVHNR